MRKYLGIIFFLIDDIVIVVRDPVGPLVGGGDDAGPGSSIGGAPPLVELVFHGRNLSRGEQILVSFQPLEHQFATVVRSPNAL